MKRMITIGMLVLMGSLAPGSPSLAHGALNYLPVPFEYNSDNTVTGRQLSHRNPGGAGGHPL